MKKLLSALVISLLATSANAKIDQEKFDKDTAYYNTHKDDAKAITVLLSQFNSDRDGIIEAFEGYIVGDLDKWQKLISKLKSAREYQNKLEAFSYFHACRSAVIYADLMWSSAPSNGRALAEWNTPDSFYAKQFRQAKKTFQSEFSDCKQAVRATPQEKDYEESDEVEKVGSWELNK
ncbi:hypothetical protein ABCW44_06905 [Mannheimia haemolytica]|uniref:hypothetical protein n=1 Tax=Mannheimia haemolytica TaxID=75985 RepID=UPI00320962F7